MTKMPIILDSAQRSDDPNSYPDKMMGWAVDFENMRVIDRKTGRFKKIRRVAKPVQWQFSQREYKSTGGRYFRHEHELDNRFFPDPATLEELFLKFLDKVVTDD